jgi:hypothetical protein
MCVVVVLIFVLSTLCCAPSRTCLYFVLLSAIFVVRTCVPRLQALIGPLTTGHPRVGFRLLIGVRFALVRAFVLRLRTHYSFIPYPLDYTFVRWHVCLSNH